jgi:hypothetical protein
VPKVIDFSVAKAVGQQVTERTLPERTDRMVPSPARVCGTLTAALVRRAATGSADEAGTDVLTLAEPTWDGEAAPWSAG